MQFSNSNIQFLRLQALSGRQSSDTCKHSASVRRFSGYGLLNTTVQEVEGFKGAVWYRYTCPYQQDLQMNIRFVQIV